MATRGGAGGGGEPAPAGTGVGGTAIVGADAGSSCSAERPPPCGGLPREEKGSLKGMHVEV